MHKILEERVSMVPEAGCWIWEGYVTPKGYGQMRHSGRTRLSHRVFFEEYKGEIPDGLHVLHKCDTPACCNPNHLFLGTNLDNIHDSISKGRRKGITRNRPSGLTYKYKSQPGAKHKISKAVVVDLLARGHTRIEAATLLGVHRNTITATLKRRDK